MANENENPAAEEQIEDKEHALISSRRVEGTPVYNRSGEKVGSIHSVMIEKRTGKVAFALMSFGGFLGLGERVHPVPWDMLEYDAKRDGYVADVDLRQIEQAPSYRLDEADRPRKRSEDELVYAYYGQIPWWGAAPY